MLYDLLLMEFYPYSSRRIAKFSSIQDYADYREKHGMSSKTQRFDQYNFNENDDVSTQVVLNDIDGEYNYILVLGDGDSIISRWFIIHKSRTTKYGSYQHRLDLRRDLMADYSDTWLNTKAFIQKGHIQNAYSPLLFNRENMTFNQIKRGEYLIPDETQSQWIVGYVARNAELTDEAKKLNGAVSEALEDQQASSNDLAYDTLESFWKLTGMPMSGSHYFGMPQSMQLNVNAFLSDSHMYTFTKSSSGEYGAYNSSALSPKIYSTEMTPQNLARSILSSANLNYIASTITGVNMINDANSSFINGLIGRTIYIKDQNQRYTVSVKLANISLSNRVKIKTTDPVFSYLNSAIPSSGTGFTSANDWDGNSFIFNYAMNFYSKLELIPKAQTAIQVTMMDSNSRTHLSDAPFDMFCMPYSDDITIKTGQGNIRSSKSRAWNAAVALVTNLASGTYDLQLLPYCPARSIILSENPDDPSRGISLNASKMSIDYAYECRITKDSTGTIKEVERGSAVCPVIWCSESNFSFITRPKMPSEFSFPSDPVEVKVRNETESARLVSPNLSGGFDFSPMMNGGVSNFRIDCTYRPFNPYIHIAPLFAHMYGGDFQDARGLVCGGDFSLPRITDAWESYQQQNKNYQAIFDRGIQDMRINQNYQMTQNVLGAVAGGFGAAGSGSIISSLTGVGAISGAIAGGLVSTAAGIGDAFMANAMTNEAINYKKDLFGFQLGNIQALPYSLAKSAAQNANNRPFPFVEFYTSSDDETQALRDKIEFDGETIGVIGIPNDYLRDGSIDYIQSLPAAVSSSGLDSDIWNSIEDEMAKGCYYSKEV